MVKILSQSGDSLADIYDAEGSIAGIEQLETRELGILHEMGATVFSERYSALLLLATSGAVLQNVAWNITLQGLPANIVRVFGIRVFVSNAGRCGLCSVNARDPVSSREFPIWSWDDVGDIEHRIRFSDDGAAVGNQQFLQPAPVNDQLPQLMASVGQPQPVSELVFRGISNAFGAGTLTATALVHVGFTEVAGLSSRGLPIPSW